jgi:hypothetical protein
MESQNPTSFNQTNENNQTIDNQDNEWITVQGQNDNIS